MQYVPTFQELFAQSKFDLDQLTDRIDKLELELSDGLGRQIKLVFDSHMAYRTRDEGDALATLDAIAESGGTGKYFYVVEDSDFIKWFQSERYEKSSGAKLKHYCIASVNFIVDVIATDPPVITEEK